MTYRPPLRAVAACVGGLAVVVGVLGAHMHDGPARTLPAQFSATATSATPPAGSYSSPIPSVSRSMVTTSSRPSSSAPPRPDHPVAAVPVRLHLQRDHIDARIVPVFSADRAIEVPDDPQVLGWWMASAPAGATTGTTVIVGHVDSARRGLGALYRLGSAGLHAGDVVQLRTSAGATISYRVNAQHVYDKSTGIPRSVFATTGPARLALITCGGPFDSTTKSYLDNIVAFATLLPPHTAR